MTEKHSCRNCADDMVVVHHPMTFDDYAHARSEFDRSPGTLWYYGLGIAGEAGEVADKIKKVFRDAGGEMAPADKEQVVLELGDVLWYLTAIATRCGVQLEDVARRNIAKLTARRARGVLHGSGDNR